MGWGEIAAQLTGQGMQSGGALYSDAKTRSWTMRMSNTAHQREVQDLIKAGLNPIMSAKGQGATSPVVETHNPMEGAADNMRETVRQLTIDAGRLQNEKAMVEANSAKADAERRNLDADSVLKIQQSGRSDATTSRLLAEIGQIEQATRTGSAQEAATRKSGDLSAAQTEKIKQETIVLKAVAPLLARGFEAIDQIKDALASNGKLGDEAAKLVNTVQNALRAEGGMPMPGNMIDVMRYIWQVVQKHAPQLLNRTTSEGNPSLEGGIGP